MKKIIIDFLGNILYKLNYLSQSVIVDNKYLINIHPDAKLGKVVIHGKVEIDEGTKIFGGVVLHTNSKISIGRYNSINGPNTSLYSAIYPITIGSFCSIARDVTFQEYNHNFKHISTNLILGNQFENFDFKKDILSDGGIILGNDVWIGAKATILSGTTIGDGCVVGANSVVKGNFPPYSIIVGSPARVIKSRFEPEIATKLLDIKWWNWPIEKIKDNAHYFQTDINVSIIEELTSKLKNNKL